MSFFFNFCPIRSSMCTCRSGPFRPGKINGQTLWQTRVGRGESEFPASMCLPTVYLLYFNIGPHRTIPAQRPDIGISLCWFGIRSTYPSWAIFLRITFPMWFQVRGVHNRYTWKGWEVEVKQQLSSCEGQCTTTGLLQHATHCPVCGFPCWCGPTLLQLLPALPLQLLWVLDKTHAQVRPTVKGGSGKRQIGVPFVFGGSTLTSLSPTSRPAFLLDFWLCWSIATSEPSSDAEAGAFHRLVTRFHNWIWLNPYNWSLTHGCTASLLKPAGASVFPGYFLVCFY